MDPVRRVTDPASVRALAHPIRLELLDYLADVEEATATECAAAVGQSVASCSFHLRMLEKYGFIERGEQHGREKPWRTVHATIDARPDDDQPGSLPALMQLAMLTVDRESARLRDYYQRAQAESPDWLQATTLTTSSFWATVEEMAEVSRQLQAIAAPFAGRHADPALRPEGARQLRMLGSLVTDDADRPT